MNILNILLVVSVAGSPIERLRYLHDKLVACLPGIPQREVVNEEMKARLVSMGLKFAKNEKERELDAFIEIYKIASKVGISDLNEVKWAIAERLYDEKRDKRSEPVDIENRVEVALVERSEPVGVLNKGEEALVGQNRSLDASDFPDDVADRFKRVCEKPAEYSTASVEVRYLSKYIVDMVQNGRWALFRKTYDIFEGVEFAQMAQVFCDSYRIMNHKTPLYSISVEDEIAIEATLHKGLFTRHAFLDAVEPYIEARGTDGLSKSQRDLSLRLEQTAKCGQLGSLHKTLDLLRIAGIEAGTIGVVFLKAYKTLA